MRRFVRWLKSDRSILRGAVVLGSGAVAGQAAMVAATPVISRLYSPTEIGHLALYLSFVGAAVTFAPLGYHRAIPSTSSRKEGATLAAGVLLLQPALCTILAIVHWFLIREGHLGFGDLPTYTVYLSGFSIAANSLLLTLQFWFIREESYPIISRVQVLQNVGRAGFQTGFGVANLGLAGLIVGDFGGRFLGIFGMLHRAAPDLVAAVRPFRPGEFLTVFRKFRRFLFPQLPSIVVNTVARLLPVPLLAHYYGAEAAGLYAMTDRILQVTVALVSKSLGNALHGSIGRYARTSPERIIGVFLKTSGALLLVGIGPTIVVLLWGDRLFPLVLGSQWAVAGEIATLLAPLALASLVVSTSSRVVYIFQAFYTVLWYNLLSLAFVLGVFLVADHHDWPMMRAISWYARLAVLAYVFYFILLLAIVRRGTADRSGRPENEKPARDSG